MATLRARALAAVRCKTIFVNEKRGDCVAAFVPISGPSTSEPVAAQPIVVHEENNTDEEDVPEPATPRACPLQDDDNDDNIAPFLNLGEADVLKFREELFAEIGYGLLDLN